MPSNVGPYAPPAGSDMGLGDLAVDYRNFIPEAGFWSYLQNLGLTGTDPRSQFAQRRQPTYYGQYLADAAKDPNMGFYDYLNQRQFNPNDEFMAQTPEQRFDFSSRTLTPRARWSVAG